MKLCWCLPAFFNWWIILERNVFNEKSKGKGKKRIRQGTWENHIDRGAFCGVWAYGYSLACKEYRRKMRAYTRRKTN